jgi:hypothetical protein
MQKRAVKTKKILFACTAPDGHFNPLTGIAVHLKNAGHEIGWYTGSHYQSKVARLGLPFYPFKKALEVAQTNIDTVFPERAKINGRLKKLKFDIKYASILRGPEFYKNPVLKLSYVFNKYQPYVLSEKYVLDLLTETPIEKRFNEIRQRLNLLKEAF